MQMMANILPFNVIHETSSGIKIYRYNILFFSLNFSIQYKIQGKNAKAKISGLKPT